MVQLSAATASGSEAAIHRFYEGCRVLVTGHAGFKGTWLCARLVALGARVAGFSLASVPKDEGFSVAGLGGEVDGWVGDVSDFQGMTKVIASVRPAVIFHLAAVSTIAVACADMRRAFLTNVMGTVNVVEAARLTDCVRGIVLVTSDKCYKPSHTDSPFREDDELGGDEAYSASKAAAEMAASVYKQPSYRAACDPPLSANIATARAGNVIGGGDWSPGRLVPDTVRALTHGAPLHLREPSAVRPWQHVLEPITGYLRLGQALCTDSGEQFRSAWNFGPRNEDHITVAETVARLQQLWPASVALRVVEDEPLHEPLCLRIDSRKARERLGWSTVWSIQEALAQTVEWYWQYSKATGKRSMDAVMSQIDAYAHSEPKASAREGVSNADR